MIKKSKVNLQASITTYVMMLFGLTVVLYMMGFTNMWTVWSEGSAAYYQSSSSANITDPGLMQNFQAIYIIIGAALLGTTLLTGLMLRATGGTAVLGYLVPLVFLIIFLNLFVFPIGSLNDELSFAGSYLPIGMMLVGFLNLFLILSIIEFVRTGNT